MAVHFDHFTYATKKIAGLITRKDTYMTDEEKKAKADDELIKYEVLNIDGYKNYFDQCVAKSSAIYGEFTGNAMKDYAVRWAKLMQAEMKKQNLEHLTKDLVYNTSSRAHAIESKHPHATGIHTEKKHDITCWLAVAWKHGEELAEITGCMPKEELKELKAAHSDIRQCCIANKIMQKKIGRI